MPNCNYYATLNEQIPIFDFIFDSQECEVYENGSKYGKPLKQLFNTDDIIKYFENPYYPGTSWATIYLQLYVIGSGPKFTPTKIKINPEKCDGHSFRYGAEGMGLIQFYPSVLSDGVLKDSHTNHFTRSGAEKTARSPERKKEFTEWDFDKVNKFSSKLNRFIRKSTVAKLRSSSVYKEALALWENGVKLFPFYKAEHEDELRIL